MIRAIFYVLLSIIGVFAQFKMVDASCSICDFFPSIDSNLTRIKWAHAVNSLAELTAALQDVTIMMIEADILMGTKDRNDTMNFYPIMGHPPTKHSDLTLEEFLGQVQQYNSETGNSETLKGIKLDFKSLEALAQSIETLEIYKNVTFPFWINADILSGPIQAQNQPVDANKFFELLAQFDNVTLSVGWTTLVEKGQKGAYSNGQIQAMSTLIQNKQVKNPITFPVRACFVAQSKIILKELLANTNNSSLTIWSSPQDDVNAEELEAFIREIGFDKVYFDLPSELYGQLSLI